VALVRERIIPTERPPHVGEVVPTFADRGCHVVSVTDPYGRILDFLDRYFFFEVAPQLCSRGWVNPVPENLVAPESNPDLWICSQELWPLDHRGGSTWSSYLQYTWLSVQHRSCGYVGRWSKSKSKASPVTGRGDSAHSWRQGCQPYAPAALYSPATLLFTCGTCFC
jgi:hypothetical protein